jgi:hypothetical protein
VEGAINAGIAFTIIPYILTDWFGLSAGYAFILFGIGAIQYARHPEGTLEAGKRKSTEFFQGLIDRRAARKRGQPPPDEDSANGRPSPAQPVGAET